MDKKKAFQLISYVCRIYKGNLEEHENLQSALRCIEDELGLKQISPTEPIPDKSEDKSPKPKKKSK